MTDDLRRLLEDLDGRSDAVVGLRSTMSGALEYYISFATRTEAGGLRTVKVTVNRQEFGEAHALLPHILLPRPV